MFIPGIKTCQIAINSAHLRPGFCHTCREWETELVNDCAWSQSGELHPSRQLFRGWENSTHLLWCYALKGTYAAKTSIRIAQKRCCHALNGTLDSRWDAQSLQRGEKPSQTVQWSLLHGPPSHTASLLWRIVSINGEKNELIPKPRLNWVHPAWRWWVSERRGMKPSQESPFILGWQAGRSRCLRSSVQLPVCAQHIASLSMNECESHMLPKVWSQQPFIHSVSV